MYDIMDHTWVGPVLGTEGEAEAFFHDWERKVKETVSKDNLLLFTATDGWGPLCQFLGTEMPSAPYPRLNNVQQFKTGYTRYIHKMNNIVNFFSMIISDSGRLRV